jgi:hypothetical protein
MAKSFIDGLRPLDSESRQRNRKRAALKRGRRGGDQAGDGIELEKNKTRTARAVPHRCRRGLRQAQWALF